MNILPGPLQITAILLSLLLPLLLFCFARLPGLHGAGRLFRIGCTTVIGLFALASFVLPGPRDPGDVLGGVLLLATAILLCHVFWSLLAWGFTLTLLTTLARDDRPLTLEQWMSTYMQGGSLAGFADNRLRLLIGSGMAALTEGEVIVTPIGMATVRLVKFIRLATGLG
jgi:hypothetical protein